ncbi:hypothetical protein C6503_23270 [Candidatus Poribacteria bacterium]|nr:MAG: hypothetical protein C6503_23270 [Candidatus Poribacteria bacterium]
MRYTGLLTILAILGLGSLLISDFSKPTHADEEPEIVSGTLEDVYGSVGLWGLDYCDPRTYSYHSTYLRNGKTKSITYTYEWNHSVIDAEDNNVVADDSEWLHSEEPLDPGETWTIYSERQRVDLEDAGVMRGKEYILDCYTSINVTGVKGSWKDSQRTGPFLHPLDD